MSLGGTVKRALLILFVMAIPATASLLTFNLSPAVEISSPGGNYYPDGGCTQSGDPYHCVIFDGTITFDTNDFYSLTGMDLVMSLSNPDGGALVLDNTPNPGLNTYFLRNVPGTMGESPAPATYTGPLFEVDVASNAPAGDYYGTATLEYTDSGGNPYTSSPVNFEVIIPEPGMCPAAGAALAGLIWMGRRRRVIPA